MSKRTLAVVLPAAAALVVVVLSAAPAALAALAARPADAVVPAPATSVWIPPWPSVRPGDVNLARVRTVQYLVRANPSPRFAIAADGVYGPATTRAIRSLQAVWRLRVTGAVDSATWSRLIRTVRIGDRGERVRAVQAALNIYGRTHPGYRLVADGVFGPRTRAAVLRFQTEVDITNDGVVNPTTWHYLVWAANRVEAAD